MMTGMNKTFEDLYNKQIDFQKNVLVKAPYSFDVNTLPTDNVDGFSFHVKQLISEVGELLSADKRWKNYRNEKLDTENKKEEIADCFIVLMNISIFSGLSAEEIKDAIEKKINNNFERINNL